MMLRKTGTGWEFVSEAALEEFVWNNLEALFGLAPLARQLRVNDEICDIVGVDQSKSLGIIELKNVEDRYVIQQLTRYYANLRTERPHSDRIDYSRSPRLLVVAPKFHRHNLIDREFSILPIEFFVVRVVREEERFFLLLETDHRPYRRIEIPYRETEGPAVDDMAPPPDQLVKWLGCCQPEFYNGLLRLRSKLLSHARVKETSERGALRRREIEARRRNPLFAHRATTGGVSESTAHPVYLPIPNPHFGGSIRRCCSNR